MTQVQHWVLAGGVLTEQTNQRATYSYDTNAFNPAYSQNANGRLASVGFGDETGGGTFAYIYSYNPAAGRVTGQALLVPATSSSAELDAAYTWDNEGRMASISYQGNGPVFHYHFDDMGRVDAMTQDGVTNQVATAAYNVANQATSLSYFGYNETRQYDNLFQLTRMTVPGMVDMEYRFTAGQNNGRISESVDYVTGEDVVYTYDTDDDAGVSGGRPGAALPVRQPEPSERDDAGRSDGHGGNGGIRHAWDA
jgi:hypothetical protein